MAIQITDKAAEKIKDLIKNQVVMAEIFGLFIQVKGGGCSGLSYDMSMQMSVPTPDLKHYEHNGANVYVEPKSYLFINGMTLDYQESIASSGFVFNNPNAKQTCGCGESFTV